MDKPVAHGNHLSPEQYLEHFEATTKKMYEITANKNQDYSAGDKAFRNFEMVQELGICTTEEGIMVRMVDKITRAANLLHKKAAVIDEKMEDTLMDLANYAIILKIYRETK